MTEPFVICYYEFTCAPNGEETSPVTVCMIDAADREAAQEQALKLKPLVESFESCTNPEHEVFTLVEWCDILRNKTATLKEHGEEMREDAERDEEDAVNDFDEDEELSAHDRAEARAVESLGEDTGHTQ